MASTFERTPTPNQPYERLRTKLTHEEIARARLTESEAAQSEQRFPLIAIFENVRSLYNVGSMFRTSDAARIDSVFTIGYTPHPPRPEIEKTALGATRTVPYKHFSTIEEAIFYARAAGYKIAALEITRNSRNIYELAETDFPLALIVGNELTGVSDQALSECDFTLEIPMLGNKHSLNVAVAYGVALFECVRVFKDQLDRFRPR